MSLGNPQFLLGFLKMFAKPQFVNSLYQFDNYVLDPARHLLLRCEEVVALPSKALDTLLVLVERQGDVISKDDLMKAVWADSFVEEETMSCGNQDIHRQARRF